VIGLCFMYPLILYPDYFILRVNLYTIFEGVFVSQTGYESQPHITVLRAESRLCMSDINMFGCLFQRRVCTRVCCTHRECSGMMGARTRANVSMHHRVSTSAMNGTSLQCPMNTWNYYSVLHEIQNNLLCITDLSISIFLSFHNFL